MYWLRLICIEKILDLGQEVLLLGYPLLLERSDYKGKKRGACYIAFVAVFRVA